MRSIGCVSLLALALALAAADASAASLAPHRAIYDLSLAPDSASGAIRGARGRIAIEFAGNACEGYTTRVRQVTTIAGESGPERTIDSNSATFEEGDGSMLRFRSESRANGATLEEVDGVAERAEGETIVTIEEPEEDRLVVSGAPLFPTQHIITLIESARAGQPLLSARLFDGTGDGRTVYDTLAVIGRPLPAEEAEDALTASFEGLARWPVRLSYFEPGPGERTPDYVIGFTLYENGVSSDLTLTFDEFTLVGALSALELTDAADCDPQAPKEAPDPAR